MAIYIIYIYRRPASLQREVILCIYNLYLCIYVYTYIHTYIQISYIYTAGRPPCSVRSGGGVSRSGFLRVYPAVADAGLACCCCCCCGGGGGCCCCSLSSLDARRFAADADAPPRA